MVTRGPLTCAVRSLLGGCVLLYLFSACDSACVGACDSGTNSSYNFSATDDTGFELLFVSNDHEFLNASVKMSHPYPSWVQGALVRNGPGKFEMGESRMSHLFDGFAKLASWRLDGGDTALFSTRFIYSTWLNRSRSAGKLAPSLLLAQPQPAFSRWEKLVAVWRSMDNMNVNVCRLRGHGVKDDHVMALTDSPRMYEISLDDLSTLKLVQPERDVVVSGREPDVVLSGREPEVKPGTRMQSHTGLMADKDATLTFENTRTFFPQPKVETQGSVEKMTMAPPDLSRVGFIDLMSVAHPLVEPGTHKTLTVVTRVSLVPGIEHELCLLRMTSPVDRERISCWPVGHKVVYLHSFSLTLTRAVVMVSPLYLKGAACILATAAPFECFEWLPHEPSVLYVITLSTGKVTAVKVTPPSVFSLHHINAYDTPAGNVVMDVVSHQNTDVLRGLMLDVLRDPVRRDSLDVHAMVMRVTIWLDDIRASVTRLDAPDEPLVASRLEFPVINELYRSRDYCYVYGIVLKADHVTFSKMLLVKKDLCTGGKRDLHLYIPGIYFLEPSFVANPRAASEDDGVLVVQGHDGVRKRATLSIIDARTFAVTSHAVMPTHIPFSFHGKFFPSSGSTSPTASTSTNASTSTHASTSPTSSTSPTA